MDVSVEIHDRARGFPDFDFGFVVFSAEVERSCVFEDAMQRRARAVHVHVFADFLVRGSECIGEVFGGVGGGELDG